MKEIESKKLDAGVEKQYFYVEAIIELPKYPYEGMNEPLNEDDAIEEIKTGIEAVDGLIIVERIRFANEKELKEIKEFLGED